MNTRTSHFAGETLSPRGRRDDETSHARGGTRQLVSSVDPSPYRSIEETLAARRSELEAELRALDMHERRIPQPPEPVARASRSVRRAALVAVLGVACGAALGSTAAVSFADFAVVRGLELDAHADLAHRRAAARAIRRARELDVANAAHVRDIVAAARAPAAASTVPVEPEAPSAPIISPYSLDDLELFVTPLGDGVWDVERAVFHSAFTTPRVRVVPAREHGRVIGVRLYGVLRASVLARHGFENGDTIVAMNRQPIGDSLEMINPFAGASRAVFAIVRRGVPRTHTYLLRTPTPS